jgi:hypothetical protein
VTRSLQSPGTSTYLDHLEPSAGGRFAALARQERDAKPSLIGTDPAAQYPKLPSSSPWAGGDVVGQEPPLGIDVNAMEPVGEAFEVEASLAASGAQNAPRHDEEEWPAPVLDELTDRVRILREYIDSGALSLEALVAVSRETFDALALYLAGFAPAVRAQKLAVLEPKWAELTALMEANAERAMHAKAIFAVQGRA